MEAEITSSRPEDLNAVLALLADASLPREGVAEHFRHFLVARADGRVVGSVGMEPYGLSVLLRSLVVAPSHRGRGLGRTLTERLLQEARKQRAQRVFLLTDTAEEFFRKSGFKPIARDEADAAVQESAEFRIACGPSTVCMCLDL
jgi:amino-acid N-acetyltransferase